MKIEIYRNRLMAETGLSRSEIDEEVKKKRDELKGLISEEGALFVICRELGVNVTEKDKEEEALAKLKWKKQMEDEDYGISKNGLDGWYEP